MDARQVFASFCLSLLLLQQASAAEVKIERSADKATVKIDGELFTEYLTKSGNKPVLWPIIAPGGKKITRGFPIDPQPGETTDHIHQRGLWFTHGSVNDVIFWNENKGSGEIVHRKFLKSNDDTIITENDWLDANGKKVCSSTQTYRFGTVAPAVRSIQVEIVLKADVGEVILKDDKEGSFGVRVADSMRPTAKPPGRIITSENLENDAAWGKPAKWVDYQGPVDGELVGIAIFDHPENPGFPTRWHVRTYGLFAANPFTQHAFDPALEPRVTKIPAGKSLTFRYWVIVHQGDEKVALTDTLFKYLGQLQSK